MVELLPLLASALVLGLLGSGHCLGMCGGLMAALSLSLPNSAHLSRTQVLLAYNLGRLLSYALAGFLAGLMGWMLSSGPTATLLRTLAAILLISMGCYLAGWWSVLNHFERLGKGLWRHLQPIASRLLPITSLRRALVVGMLWGWLPCGLVYSTLLWAASQGSALNSLLLMLAFGLGTCPILVASGLAAERLNQWLRKQQVRQASGLLVILFGLWSLPGPHQQWLMGHAG